ncbi:MAG: PaaI family thioesterase [Proteobacteria bacterium]|nr:PaaI family thioesterase [Pseudomonadota bacterium]MBU1585801.1 PaaI family thioesterase [Pseudomonadota bacterium]MBU2453061.1 PaaI family thioesterase [Pseudomonadota bacterium]MBU2630839.1 PaaI family thioesterase [Pseudomonadota bacterium]
MAFQPLDPEFEQKVRSSFSRQMFMEFLHAELIKIEPGFCEIHVPYRKELTQQHGFFHAGVMGTIADNCGGYAAFSLMPKDASVLSVEYKLNLLAPGNGELLTGQGRVIKPGKNLTICSTEIFIHKNKVKKLCATSLMTLMTMHGKKDR